MSAVTKLREAISTAEPGAVRVMVKTSDATDVCRRISAVLALHARSGKGRCKEDGFRYPCQTVIELGGGS